MGLFSKLLFGRGALKPELRAELEAEGLVVLEEYLWATIRYKHFKAPGRRHHGKVVAERIALGISEERFVAYCRSGKGELMDSRFDDPKLAALQVSLDGDDRVVFEIDYGLMDMPKVEGEVTIRVKTPNAPAIAEELRKRLP